MDSEPNKIPLDEVAEWKRHGSDLRKRLLEQRKAHVEALAKIDRALADLPSESNGHTNGVAANGHASKVNKRVETTGPSLWTLKRGRLQDIVDTVVSRHPAGITAKAVVEEVLEIKRTAVPHNVYTALYRSKKIRGEGDSRSKTYYPLETTPV